MKAKKPLLLAVLILALLAVALILPASALGKSDNQPVAQVSFGVNSGPLEMPLPPPAVGSIVIQIGLNTQVQVRQVLNDAGNLVEEISGHMVNTTIKPPEMRAIATNGSGNALVWAIFGTDSNGNGNTDEAWVCIDMYARTWFPPDPEEGPVPPAVVHVGPALFWFEDGGEPALGVDAFEMFLPDGSGGWYSPIGQGTAASNVQIHISGDYVQPSPLPELPDLSQPPEP